MKKLHLKNNVIIFARKYNLYTINLNIKEVFFFSLQCKKAECTVNHRLLYTVLILHVQLAYIIGELISIVRIKQ